MNELKIMLNFPKSMTDLTGNRFGRNIFETQVRPKMDSKKKKVIVELPTAINDVGTSFIQGMYAYLSEEYGNEKALSIMQLCSKNEETNAKIQRVINIYGI